MINPEDFRSAGALPQGPVSAWPKERHEKLIGSARAEKNPHMKLGARGMASGFLKTAGMALKNGKVEPALREERMEICRQCPSYREDDKRCSECGCFMEAKTWVAGDPKMLCPLAKWPE